mgnify:CR=1 FL=1
MIFIMLLIVGIVIVIILLGLPLGILAAIVKNKAIKQEQLVQQQRYQEDLAFKAEVLKNMNSKV